MCMYSMAARSRNIIVTNISRLSTSSQTFGPRLQQLLLLWSSPVLPAGRQQTARLPSTTTKCSLNWQQQCKQKDIALAHPDSFSIFKQNLPAWSLVESHRVPLGVFVEPHECVCVGTLKLKLSKTAPKRQPQVLCIEQATLLRY